MLRPGLQCVLHTQTHACSLMLYALTDTQNQIVVWQQDWLLYLSCCYSNKHRSLSLICCAKQSPYQHLAHHAALCQSGPQCQDCQPMTEAQTHFLYLHLPHGFIIILLSLPHQTAKKHNLWMCTLSKDRLTGPLWSHCLSNLGEHCVFL